MPYATITYGDLKIEVRTLDVHTHAVLRDPAIWQQMLAECRTALLKASLEAAEADHG